MSLHAWRPQGPRKPSSCTTSTLSPHCGRGAPGKKRIVSMHAGSIRSCPTLCDPVDCGLPGISVRERVLQARILERIGQHWLPYSSGLLLLLLSHVSCVQLGVTPLVAAQQAPLSLGFSRQEHWSGLPFPSLMHESEKGQ